MTLTKPSRIKRIDIVLEGKARTEWPEGTYTFLPLLPSCSKSSLLSVLAAKRESDLSVDTTSNPPSPTQPRRQIPHFKLTADSVHLSLCRSYVQASELVAQRFTRNTPSSKPPQTSSPPLAQDPSQGLVEQPPSVRELSEPTERQTRTTVTWEPGAGGASC